MACTKHPLIKNVPYKMLSFGTIWAHHGRLSVFCRESITSITKYLWIITTAWAQFHWQTEGAKSACSPSFVAARVILPYVLFIYRFTGSVYLFVCLVPPSLETLDPPPGLHHSFTNNRGECKYFDAIE